MVRGGRGYNFGGQREHITSNRGSYRGSSSNYYNSRNGSGRSGGTYNSNNHGNYRPSQYNYDSRSSRDKHSDREHKRHFSASRDRSPDRKRSRHENSRLDSSYPSSSSYHRRLDNTSRNSRQTPPPSGISSVSRVPSSYRSGATRRDDSSQRKSTLNSRRSIDSMGPPKNIVPRNRIISRPRGTLNRLRGNTRNTTRLSGNSRITSRTRRPAEIRIIRKRILLASQKDRARRIKIARLATSLRKRREEISKSKSNRRSRTEKSNKTDDEKSRSKSKSESKDIKKKVKSTKISKMEEDDTESKEIENLTDKEIIKEEPESNVENEDHVEQLAKEDDAKSDKESEKQEKKTKEIEHETKSSVKKTDRRTRSRSNSPRGRRSYIKLTCVQCRMKCLTFQDYNNHLYLRVHKVAMRRLALRQKAQLSAMRLKQRNAQRELEESLKEESENCKPQFCMLCRLNYRIPKEKHQVSEHHRNMKKFLMPYCRVCHLSFQSPMMYENHRCSLEHIKRKARTSKKSHSESSNEEREVDLANFTTVDSVGEVDFQDENEDNTENNEDDKEKILVGTEYVKKIEAFYCELCRIYFPVKEDDDTVIKKHCAIRSHLKSFLRHKEDQYLQVEAERVQRKENKEKKCNSEKALSEEKESEIGEAQPEVDDEDIVEDKLWQDVDKDLGDLLREVGPKEDEEDESVLNIETERFDKFKNSEKSEQINGEVNKENEVNEINEEEPHEVDEEMKKPVESTENDEPTIESN